MKKLLCAALALCMLLASAPWAAMAAASPGGPSGGANGASFEAALEDKYVDPDRIYSTEVRWWLNTAALTDETLLAEIQAIYDGGFRGIELCMQRGSTGDMSAQDMYDIYAYGSPQWAYKWKLMMNKILDLGMTVSLTSGTHWATSNVPGLDPNSQAAMQVAAMSGTPASVNGGDTFAGALPPPATLRTVTDSDPVEYAANFIGAYAYRQAGTTPAEYGNGTDIVVDFDSIVDVTAFVADGANPYDKTIDWTAPDDGGLWRVYGLWYHGNNHNSSPAAGGSSYATNYFDTRGFDALKAFWEEHYLDDAALNAKILAGDVQLFMDSMEINATGGITQWAEDFAETFIERKGYDICPYLFLLGNLGATHNAWSQTYRPMAALLTHQIEGDADNELLYKIVFDYQDFLTTMFCERMFDPLRAWLNSYGIKTRAQISYGRPFEMSEPIMHVDYPETENRVMYNQQDMWRFWTGGSKLQNKVLSSETSAHSNSGFLFDNQLHLRDAYNQFASGIQRTIWHIWSSDFDYGATPQAFNANAQGWPVPGAGGAGFYKFGTREPSSRDYDELNAHLGRIQQMMQTGKSRTDVGFIQQKWFQHMLDFGEAASGNISTELPIDTPANMNRMNYQLAHQGIFYRSTELQDNGYTYDYFSPEFLNAPEVYFDKTAGTLEPAGYKALVLWQEWLDPAAAKKIVELAKDGLPVVILDGAVTQTPFNDGADAELAATVAELKSLSNVRVADVDGLTAEDFSRYHTEEPVGFKDDVLAQMQSLGVRPYAQFAEPNHQLLTQSRVDEDGNMFLYAYNYCPDTYHQYSHIESVRNESHGTNIKTEIEMEGLYVPYSIDAWTGEATQLGLYRHEDGRTVFPIDLDFDDVAMYAFEPATSTPLHAVSTDAASAFAADGRVTVRATKSGAYYTTLSNGSSFTSVVAVPAAYDIVDWDVTVESWTPGDEIVTRQEPRVADPDAVTVNSKYATAKTPISVTLPKLATWDNIPEVGRAVSGTARYEATFEWDASTADGAYLDFGDSLAESMKVWVNGRKVGGDVSSNPTKAKASVGLAIDGQTPEGKDQFTGGVSMMKPIADIGDYLVDGENSVVIEYSSGLTNVQLARGAIAARPAIYGWFNYNGDYRSYGPAQAVVVPYVDSESMEVGVTAAEAIRFGDKASFVFSAKNMDDVNLIDITFEADATRLAMAADAIEGLNGFAVFETMKTTDLGNGRWQGNVVLGAYTGAKIDGDLDVASLDLGALKLGVADVKIVAVEVYGIDGSGGAEESSLRLSIISPAAASTRIGSPYDVNGDFAVNHADLSLAFYYYQSKEGDANWNAAKAADVNGSGLVDITDLTAIYANYIAK